MAKQTKLARPYARAAFEFALAEQQLEQWSTLLNALAAAVKEPPLAQLLQNPKYSSQEIAEILISIYQKHFDQAKVNFLKQLAEKRRLTLLPDIADLFSELKLQAEQIIDVHVSSAIPLADEYKHQLNQVMNRKLGQHTILHFDIDESLLGGLLIRAGDHVIDGSVRGRLARMREALIGH